MRNQPQCPDFKYKTAYFTKEVFRNYFMEEILIEKGWTITNKPSSSVHMIATRNRKMYYDAVVRDAEKMRRQGVWCQQLISDQLVIKPTFAYKIKMHEITRGASYVKEAYYLGD